ncbi:MAG: replicative DNA helicase [Clostridiales bacterium]|jgi:replicative DNA helicase|nr:replicative DNA helicase [Clostridiales bacterium]
MISSLPNDLEAEQAFLSCLLYDYDNIQSEQLDSENFLLVPEDFYSNNNKIIYKSMLEISESFGKIDLITLRDYLDKNQLLNKIGGDEYLQSLCYNFYTSANVQEYKKIIKEKSNLRNLIKISNDISRDCYSSNKSFEIIFDEIEKKLFDLSQNINSNRMLSISEILSECVKKAKSFSDENNKYSGIPTGFNVLDDITGGLQNSDLILIAARPAMGKTAFALNIATNASLRANTSIAIFSLEMPSLQVGTRILCSEAQVNNHGFKINKMDNHEWERILDAIIKFEKSTIIIDDTPAISCSEIRHKVRKLKIEKNIGLVIVDYLQLIKSRDSKNSRQQEISDISRSLKEIAREFDLPIIALSQLSRACETRADHRPMLSDLRESGAIEQDADIVAFLYRDSYYNPENNNKDSAELIIAKHRNGSTGIVELHWKSFCTRFFSITRI